LKHSLVADEADGHGVEGEGAEEVAAHALLDLGEGSGGSVDPIDGDALAEAFQLGGKSRLRMRRGVPATTSNRSSMRLPRARSRLMVFPVRRRRPVALSGVEEQGIVRFARAGGEDEGVLAAAR